MQLFYKGDIIQMRDKSQWEIVSCSFEKVINEFLYEYQSLENGQINREDESILNRKAIVIRFTEKIERPKCKVYNLEDYRRKKLGRIG